MYVVFVGHPGVGKGRSINPAIKVVRKANTANILSDKLTIQYILEKLSVGFTAPHATVGGGFTFGKDSSCLISAAEMEVFLATSEAMPSLSELWECKDGPSDYGTRGKGLISVEKPCPTLIGGMTPRQVVDYMSTRVVSGGFTRRVNFVYTLDKEKSIPRPRVNGSYATVVDDLINDLRHISTLQGEVKLTEAAWALFEPYYHIATKVDEFDDEVFVAYASTKPFHVLKLATVLSVSRSDSLHITEVDIENAIVAVERCSNDLMKVFRSVGDSDVATSSDRVMRFIEAKGIVSRSDIMQAMWRHMTSPELDLILNTLESGNMVDHQDRGGKLFYYETQAWKVKRANDIKDILKTMKGATGAVQ